MSGETWFEPTPRFFDITAKKRELGILSPEFRKNMRFWNHKSQKRWQKSFINNVFAHKTERHDTFSKILINNPELLSSKNIHIPKSIYKFYAPTAENIIDIKKKRLWLSHPKSFNDPFDCHTGYDATSYEKLSILEYIKQIGLVAEENKEHGFTESEFYRIYNSTTEYIWGFNNKYEEYWKVIYKLRKEKSEEFQDKLYKMRAKISNEVEEKISKLRDVNIRIACFSELNSNNFPPKANDFEHMIQMWSHYADNHKGFCVEYDISTINPANLLPLKQTYTKDNKDAFLAERTMLLTVAGLFPVIYSANRVNIPKTKLKKIRIDENNILIHNSEIDAILYKTFIVKSAKWNYEKEWRIIIDGDICQFFDNKIPFPFIKKIFLGCKMEQHNIDTMLEIADELNIEVVSMRMDNKKFILEPQGLSSYKRDKEWSKLRNPLYS